MAQIDSVTVYTDRPGNTRHLTQYTVNSVKRIDGERLPTVKLDTEYSFTMISGKVETLRETWQLRCQDGDNLEAVIFFQTETVGGSVSDQSYEVDLVRISGVSG